MALLSLDQILRLHAAIISGGLAGSRGVLLGGLDATFVAGLPTVPDLSGQVLSDLQALNALPEIADGTTPLRAWLETALHLARLRVEREVFCEALASLGAGERGLASKRSEPKPRYADAATQALAEQIERASARRLALKEIGAPTKKIDREILDQRRRLREGGQLRAGDALGSGRYLLIDQVGRGGFSTVWEAYDRERHERVAVKVLHGNLAGDPIRLERFFRGARTMAELGHEHVVRVLEQRGEDGGYHYFVMELIHGGNLQQAVLKKMLPGEAVIPVILKVGEALAVAHRRGLIHRDVKPSNILLDAASSPRLTDFDLVAASDTTGGTRTGAMGTVVYTAPEITDRPQDADPRADVYSLAMTAVFGLHGAELSMLSVRDVEKLIDTLSCNNAVKAVLKSALDWNKEARVKDAGEFCDALRLATAIKGGLGVQAASDVKQTFSGEPPLENEKIERKKSSRRDEQMGTFPAGRPRQTLSAWNIVLAAGIAALIGVGVALQPWQKATPLPPLSHAAPAPRPTALTDLPLPSSRSPEALAAYTEALQALRDGNWEQTEASLRRAIALDPLMTAAHLRLAMVIDTIEKSRREAQQSYHRAVLGRAWLSERDQVLLRALEPLFVHDPPERSLAAQRLREATERYPLDAELFAKLAYIETADHEAALRAARRASELDPQYADAWQSMGEHLSLLERIEESLEAFDQCLAISPTTADCHGARALQLGALGRCVEMEEGARRAITSGPKVAPGWYESRAVALHALGRPQETVLEAFTQKWAEIPEQKRRAVELSDRARLDIEAGRFDEAEARAREGNGLIRSDRDVAIHLKYANLFILIYTETGRPREAARIADDYLKRKDVWVGAREVHGSSMFMLRTMLHAGALSKDGFERARAEWLSQGSRIGDIDPGRLWLSTYTDAIEQREEAEEALAALAKLPQGAISQQIMRRYSARLGRMYLLAGRVDEALPFLRPANRACRGPGETPPDLPLGQALEQKGDKEGACAAYAAVLDRWGDAKPRSVTAEKARARVRALGCAERQAGAVHQRRVAGSSP